MSDTKAIATVIAAGVRVATASLVSDVSGVQSQIATWEARWSDFGELRERVALVEVKASADVLTPVLGRLDDLEARARGADGPPGSMPPELQDRIVALERALASAPQDIPPEELALSLTAAVQAELVLLGASR